MIMNSGIISSALMRLEFVTFQMSPKVVSLKGKEVVGKLAFAQSDLLVTVVCCLPLVTMFRLPSYFLISERNEND
jgi:hypothetical protein